MHWEDPEGVGWGGRSEGGSGWATHVNPWLIHFNVWQKPLQYCKVTSLQLIKINGKKKRIRTTCKVQIERDRALEKGKQVWFGSDSESELAPKREEIKVERMSTQLKN